MAERDNSPVKPIPQEQLHNLLFSREIGWQEIIYDLINTEQLDPWDVDITLLTDKYLERIRDLEEADFFISSKVLLAAALLLRIKSEILLNKYIRSIDEILFGKKDEKKYEVERINFDEPLPELIPKSPLPRFRRVTLHELMESLNKAIITENRRIRKKIIATSALREIDISIPKKKLSIKDKIRELYERLVLHFRDNQHKKRVSFTELVGEDKEERLVAFSPLLHLDYQKKVWLEQERHFEDFYIWLNNIYFANNPDPYADLREKIDEKTKELNTEQKERMKKIEKDFSNPLGEMA